MKTVQKLDQFYFAFETLKPDDIILNNNGGVGSSFFAKLFSKKTEVNKLPNIPLKGIYLWGGVGCGVS